MRATFRTTSFVLSAALAAPSLLASSHMDAPLITLDDAANTTDVYAFLTADDAGAKYLSTAVSVYPFEDPGIGPNKYNFDDNVRYAIHVALGDDRTSGRPTLSYFFNFDTTFKNEGTILQSYTGIVQDVDDASQNLTQRYRVTKIDRRPGQNRVEVLGTGLLVPPNNQGIVTPEYNTLDGEGVVKGGVDRGQQLDRYTDQTVHDLGDGYSVFAGQRDDAFYADIQAVFDLLNLRDPAKDSQKGFNVHTIALRIPVSDLGGDMQVAGVWATTSRRQIEVRFDNFDPIRKGRFVQVARQGNPLFCEALVAIADKDKYSRTGPHRDQALFAQYATQPELAALLNGTVFDGNPLPNIETNRDDIAGIFIPDLIKVDLSTDAARLAGGGADHATNPDDAGFSRLSVFGGDELWSPLQQAMVPGGWPNGRRFGDDVLDIAVSAVISEPGACPPVIRVAGDNVNSNDVAFSKVMPYAPTPQNGRNHAHD